MLLPCNQISPTSPSATSASFSVSTMTPHWLRGTRPQETCERGLGGSGGTRPPGPGPAGPSPLLPGVDDDAPLAAGDPAARTLRDGVGSVARDSNRVPRAQLLSVQVDNRRPGGEGDGRDEEGRLGHPVRRLDRRARQPVRGERRVELL